MMLSEKLWTPEQVVDACERNGLPPETSSAIRAALKMARRADMPLPLKTTTEARDFLLWYAANAAEQGDAIAFIAFLLTADEIMPDDDTAQEPA